MNGLILQISALHCQLKQVSIVLFGKVGLKVKKKIKIKVGNGYIKKRKMEEMINEI